MTPPLLTERLALTIATPADAARLAAYHAANRAHLAPWEPLRPEAYFTEDYWRAFLEGETGASRFLLAPKEAPDGPLVGAANLTAIARGPLQAAYLGYSLAEKAQGKGLMREALRAVIAHAFGAMNLHRLMANHLPENARSAALLEALGFTVEGLAHEYLLIAGRWRDHVLRALVNRDWKAPA